MTRSQSLLFSILAFAAYAYAISHAHRGHLSNNVWRQAANKGEDREATRLRRVQQLITNSNRSVQLQLRP